MERMDFTAVCIIWHRSNDNNHLLERVYLTLIYCAYIRFLFSSVKPSAPIITGLQDPFLLSAQPTITCTVEQVKPENATVLWRREGELEELDSLAEVTVGEAGVATVVSRFTGSFDVADNGRTLQCIAMPGMDAEEYTVMTSVVIRLTGACQKHLRYHCPWN